MDIREFAHLSMGGQDWTEAFREAIAQLSAQGGGVLTVPPGEYPTGSIRLDSHITLDIQNGAALRFFQREEAFPLIALEFEGVATPMYQACVYAQNAEYVKITGDGVIDGCGDYWWRALREKRLKHPRPYLICFADCRHVTLENVNLHNSPCWTVHPLRCQDVVVRGVRILNPADSPNTDGINPDACQDVRILDCTIDVGDDCIAIKSGTEDTPNRQPCERVLIANCHFLHGHGGVVLGSEMSGNIRNVVVSNCVFYETDRGVRLKTRRGRGGIVEGVQLSNLVMEKVMCPFTFNMYYYCGKDGKTERVRDKAPYPVDASTPRLRDVSIVDVTARACGACAGFFYGLPESPIEGVTLKNVLVEMDENGESGLPAMMDDCPRMQGEGFYLRNAGQVRFEGVRVVGVKGDLMNIDRSVRMENQA